MSGQRTILSRHWIPIVSGSCDVRMGWSALASASKVLRDSVSVPHTCFVVSETGKNDKEVDELKRQAANAGFVTVTYEASAPVRSLDSLAPLANMLAHECATADDLCCVVGDADLLSLVGCVCGAWCQSMQVVAVPTSEVALLEGALVPRSLDVAGISELFAVRPSIQHVLFDFDLAFGPSGLESALYTRVLMAGAAMADSEREFSALWDNADALMEGDEEVRCDLLVSTAKARGKLSGSSVAVVRCALNYGKPFARACKSLAPELPYSALVAEGMRFCARLAVAQGKLSIDDMLAQDELLERLGIYMVSASFDPNDLLEAINAERTLRSRRVLWEIPNSIGKIRLATVKSEMLREHVDAWCGSHDA